MKTSLHLIVKDEVEQVHSLIKQAEPYFTSIFITISDSKAYHALERERIHTNVQLDFREWTGKFDDQGQPIMDYVWEEVLNPATGEPEIDEDGRYIIAPVPTQETEIAFTDVDLTILISLSFVWLW